MRRYTWLIAIVLVLAACGGSDDDDGGGGNNNGDNGSGTTVATGLAAEPILSVDIPGTANSSVTSDSDEEIVRKLDVTGDWEAVAVELVTAARAGGFQITRVNCTGSGYDIIGVKTVGEGVHLVEGRSGTSGVIISVSAKDAATFSFRSTGQCPGELVNAAL